MRLRREGLAVAVAVCVALPAIAACRGPAAQDDGAPGSSASPSADQMSSGPAPRDGATGPVPLLSDPRIAESSGLARSNRHTGVYYTHNDRGSPPQLFAVDPSGTRAVLELDVTAIDWEDIASTPDGRLWVADIGDNEEIRSSVEIVVVEEPDVLVSANLPATTYTLRYPDGPHDAEALLVDPVSDLVHIVTKGEERGWVYETAVPLDAQAPNVLRRVGSAPNNITAGDIAPDGRTVVLRNQGKAFFYPELGGTPTEVVLPRQPQGESVAFTAGGSHVLLGSEGPDSTLVRLAVPRLEG